MGEEVYDRLREFLDRMPGGYPATPGGVEIKILKKLVAPDEAELMLRFPIMPETIAEISRLWGTESGEAEKLLGEMVQHGFVHRFDQGGKPVYYPVFQPIQSLARLWGMIGLIAAKELGEKEALVLMPSNTVQISFVCSCCGCCCGNLLGLKMLPRPGDFVASSYEARIDPKACNACGVCLDRCQVAAIKEGEENYAVADGRCIGCGLCVPECPENAIKLHPRPKTAKLPNTWAETLVRIGQERKLW